MAKHYQIIVIGGGHNGLVCAAYLARAGRSVIVLEAADQIGGAARTRALQEGARVSSAAHLLHSMPEDLIRDLGLKKHGLKFAGTSLPTLSLTEAGEHIVIDGDRVTGVSEKDREALVRFNQDMRRFANALRPVFNDLPPELSIETWPQRLTLLRLGLKVRRLGRYHMRELLRIIAMNLYDLLDEYFDSPQLKAALAMDAVLGGEWGPRSMGTVLSYISRVAGRERGGMGVALPEGGMGSVTAALAAAARDAGVEIRTGCRVQEILIENDAASGVLLDDGEMVRGDTVISNADPKQTFMNLVSPDHLDTGFVRQVRNLRSRGRAAKLHLVLSEAPKFRGVAEGQLGARLVIAPGMDDIERAFNPSKYGRYPENPVWEITVPTAIDGTLATNGQHVLSAIIQFVPYDDGEGVDDRRAEFLETIIGQLERYAPGIRDSIEMAELLTPRDIERQFGMSGGHWHHVEFALENFLFNRPTPTLSRHASPIVGLYLCGAGCHPGGDVMGIPGRNAADQVMKGGR